MLTKKQLALFIEKKSIAPLVNELIDLHQAHQLNREELIQALVALGPLGLMNALCEKETFGLSEDQLQTFFLIYLGIFPETVAQSLEYLPISEERKEQLIIYLLASENQGARNEAYLYLDNNTPLTIHTQRPPPSFEHEGEVLVAGICYGRVRGSIERAITKEPLPPSKERFLHAGHRLAMSSLTREALHLPKGLEKKLTSKEKEHFCRVKLSEFPLATLLLNRASQGKPQQYALFLHFTDKGVGHCLYLSLENPPGIGFSDPEDFDLESAPLTPRFHRFPTPEKALLTLLQYLTENYHSIESVAGQRFE